jgi:ABC-type sugar transport system ATPase subunit
VLVDANAPHAGTVLITEPLGDATLVHFDYGQGRTLVAKVPPTTTLAPGATLRFHFAPQACHLFDAAGGGRLNGGPVIRDLG